MGFPILIRWLLYIESGPRLLLLGVLVIVIITSLILFRHLLVCQFQWLALTTIWINHARQITLTYFCGPWLQTYYIESNAMWTLWVKSYSTCTLCWHTCLVWLMFTIYSAVSCLSCILVMTLLYLILQNILWAYNFASLYWYYMVDAMNKLLLLFLW